MSKFLSLTKLAQKVGGEKRLAQWVKRGYLTPTATTAAGRGLYTMADYRRAQKNSTRFIDMATLPELPHKVYGREATATKLRMVSITGSTDIHKFLKGQSNEDGVQH